MQYVHLGRSGLKVSRLCLGTMNFGMVTEEDESFRIMDKAYTAGINLFDTADVYGGPQSPDMKKGFGISEEIIGKWLKKNGRRNEVILSTKVYQPMGSGPNDRHLSALHIRNACDASLRRLQTDHIDIYFMHHIDRAAPWEEIWQAMEVLTAQGKIIYVASSNFAGWQIAAAQGEARARNFMGLVAEQSKYNLAARMVELEVLPSCRHFGLGMIPWSPLDGGLLGGALHKEAAGRRATPELRQEIDKHRSQLEAYEAFCHEAGLEPADVAIAWLLHNPAVTAPLIGPRTADQLPKSLKALDVRLTEEMLSRLDKIWPGPGGEAPEAYAW